jgi:hypothetical protein
LLNIVNPAIGILETSLSFKLIVWVVVGGVVVVCVGGGVVGVFGFGFAKGLNCEKKFVPVVGCPVWLAGLLKYKNPKTARIIITRTIIKSIKFLFDIKFD